ncbi:MAG: hypothetical protein N0E44_18945 [Candidatus Thiodiazotropha lotti]|nr:hypothetical protein [Candidatus Thiodiazotropha lotti]MCW4221963.1 hypothetical protein [Candidatus Thiodiazotropha lotti]
MSRINYTITSAKLSEIDELLADLRQADADEMAALSFSDPHDTVAKSIALSPRAYTLRVEGELVCIFGVGMISMVGPEGAPWLLGTNAIKRHRRVFLELSKPISTYLLSNYAHLRQLVDVRNRLSVRWLKWLGFDFHGPIEAGHKGELFFVVTMENSLCVSSQVPIELQEQGLSKQAC